MSDEKEKFVDEVLQSLSSGSFVKLTLSNYKGSEPHLQKIVVRVIDTKRGRQLAFQSQLATRQTVKNFSPSDGALEISRLIESGFRNAHLFTTSRDFQLTIGKKSSRLIDVRPTFRSAPSTTHDREKKSLVSSGAPYLKALGISDDKGQILPTQRDKWRQINKFVEILRDLFDKSELRDRTKLKVVDMGSGKGYLTFAAYDYFANSRNLEIEMTGVDSREDLVELCNQIAASCGFDGLRFVAGSILDYEVGTVDVLIALHACDTATDDALYKGISSNAAIIVAAPCCHKEVRRQIRLPQLLKAILKHGTMLEREAETVTDGLRSMLLERSGYASKVFEFVPTEHTPKNNMIVAIQTGSDGADSQLIQEQIDAIKEFYGIREQRLENLLA